MSISKILFSLIFSAALVASYPVSARTFDRSQLDGSNASQLDGRNAPASAQEAKIRRLAKRTIKHYRKMAKKLMSEVNSDFKSATSTSYAKDYFKELSEANVSVKDAADLTFQAYDLAANSGLLELGEVQDKVEAVRLSMSNAEDLAEVSEEGDALDVATLRCSQNTEDGALSLISQYLNQAHVKSYKAAKKEVCSVVLVLADLRYKRQQYEALKTDGYPLFYKHKKDKKNFSGYERTVQYKVDLRFYPGDQDVLNGDFEHGNFEFIHAFKWSDNNWGDNNLKEAFADDSKDDLICLPFIKISNNAKADLCFQVTSVTSSEAKVYTKAKFKYKDDKKSIAIGTITIPAPFGYLADLSDMKEDKMQDLEENIKDKISGFLPIDQEMLEALQSLAESQS